NLAGSNRASVRRMSRTPRSRLESPGGDVSGLLGALATACIACAGADARRRRNVTKDRKSTRLNSRHGSISYAVFCLKKQNKEQDHSGVLHIAVVEHAPVVPRGPDQEHAAV